RVVALRSRDSPAGACELRWALGELRALLAELDLEPTGFRLETDGALAESALRNLQRRHRRPEGQLGGAHERIERVERIARHRLPPGRAARPPRRPPHPHRPAA